MGFKEWIIPQDKIFFNLLEEQARIVLTAAELFKEIVSDYDLDGLGVRIKRMHALEHEGDDLVHKIVQKLNKSFITPIDQEDISKLTSSYDDVLDYIDAVANKLFLFKIENPDGVIEKFASIIVEQVKEANGALSHIRKIKQEEIEARFKEVHKLENEADDLYDSSMVKLFKEKDPVKILIMKEIYEFLEEITDKCEDVCLVIQDIVIKNA
jgi:predicted phosphate transport protein (TIGR00153 family)